MSDTLRDISDTALWVAMFRAAESERPDAIFRDPFARRLAGARGEQIVRAMNRRMSIEWPIVVRTAVTDELVLRCVQQGCATVLNLAAGLDARPWRLSLPAPLRWIDADKPGMVAHKSKAMADVVPACAYEAVGIDLADRDARKHLFERAAQHGPVLVLSEGLLVYLDEDAVAGLADQLFASTAMRWWLFDLASPQLLRMLNRRFEHDLQAAASPMRFAPTEGTAFFARHGWREVQYRSTWLEAMRLRRTPRMAWMWNLLGKLAGERKREQFRRFSGIVLTERGEPN
ncbi:MAG: SAM-dependent methyltransferase [Planctomycetes bacterium]|nr:SAM-dependent methyltransferase [Planctomycetota bacterium]